VAVYIVYDFLSYNFGSVERYPRAFIEPTCMLLAATAVRWAAARVRFDPTLGSVRSVLMMVAVSLVYAATNASAMTAGFCGLAQARSCVAIGWPSYWAQAAVGDVFGCLICMPALLTGLRAAQGPMQEGWTASARALGRALKPDRARLYFVSAGAAAAFASWWVTRHVAVPVHVVGYLAVPLLVWAALKFPPRFVHNAILAIGLVTISLQLIAGAAVPPDPVAHIASLFLFLLSVSALTLLVNVVLQRQRTLASALAFRQQQERIEWMLDAASDAVISFDAAGRLSYWNPAAERMFGVPSAGAQGRRVDEFLPVPGLAELGGNVARLRDQKPELFSGHVVTMDSRDAEGQPLPLEVSLTAYRNGSEWQATAFVRDASAHQKQQEALRQAKDRAEEATRVKSMFLATMSHELRTPLSGVIGMLQLALRGEMLWATRAKVNLALSNAEGLLAIINDILDYSKIEAGKMGFEQVDFDLRELVQSLAALLEMNAQEKGLSLICRVAPAVPQWVRCDPVRLRQVLFNLAGNALKFTERGFVELRFDWVLPTDGSQGPQLEVEVQDTGIGISPETQQRLFRGFEQADASTTRHYGGTGLGLAISKSLIEGLGGQITVRSRVGEGTCFSFRLPVEEGVQPQQALQSEAGPFDCRLKLLCAEDGATNRMIVRAFVEDMGHEIEFVENGREAVRRCAEERFDVVLMDGRMPVLDGTEASRAIRAGGLDDQWVLEPDVWIIALTANASVQDREQCLAAGMDDFLAKPVNERQLAEALHRAVKALRERGRALTSRAPAGEQAAARLEALFGDEMVAADDAAFDHTSAAVLPAPSAPPREQVPLGTRLRAAFREDGRQTLSMLRQALEAADWSNGARLAHSLKGSALYVGFPALAQAAGWLEACCDAPPPPDPLAQCGVLEELFEAWAREP
jgi:PAS domain S-box-containing protein